MTNFVGLMENIRVLAELAANARTASRTLGGWNDAHLYDGASAIDLEKTQAVLKQYHDTESQLRNLENAMRDLLHDYRDAFTHAQYDMEKARKDALNFRQLASAAYDPNETIWQAWDKVAAANGLTDFAYPGGGDWSTYEYDFRYGWTEADLDFRSLTTETIGDQEVVVKALHQIGAVERLILSDTAQTLTKDHPYHRWCVVGEVAYHWLTAVNIGTIAVDYAWESIKAEGYAKGLGTKSEAFKAFSRAFENEQKKAQERKEESVNANA